METSSQIYIPTSEMVADSLTKAIKADSFEKALQLLRLESK
jgi:hypothetical protein